jgi:hypothetical protein
MVTAFDAGVRSALEKIADIPLAQNIARPLLGQKTKKLGDVVRTYVKGQGWLTVPPRLGGR